MYVKPSVQKWNSVAVWLTHQELGYRHEEITKYETIERTGVTRTRVSVGRSFERDGLGVASETACQWISRVHMLNGGLYNNGVVRCVNMETCLEYSLAISVQVGENNNRDKKNGGREFEIQDVECYCWCEWREWMKSREGKGLDCECQLFLFGRGRILIMLDSCELICCEICEST